MSVNSEPPVQISSKPPGGGGNTPGSSKASLWGRTWKVITYIPDAGSKTVMSSDGLYKFAKVVKSVCQATMVLFNDMSLAVASPFNKLFGELDAIIGPATIIERANHFISGKAFEKDKDGNYKCSIWKNLNAGTLIVVKGTEGFIWMGKRGADLGKLAQSMGGTPLYNVTSRMSAVTFKNYFSVSASLFAIIEITRNMVKHCKKPSAKDDPVAKQILALINESGKIILTLAGAYYFTYAFAVVSLMTAGSGMAKFLYSKYQPKPSPESPPPTLPPGAPAAPLAAVAIAA